VSRAERPPQVAFGELLQHRRQASGLTQDGLSERAGVSVRTICDLECGRRKRPYPQTVRLLAEALGLQGPQLDEFVRLSGRSMGLPRGDGHMRPVHADSEPEADAMTGRPGDAPVPRQLPMTVSHFTGRVAELETLSGMLGEASGARTVVISALSGTAGVGKTAVAVQWAHEVAEHFPGGQLYVNLRGYDPGEPVAATDALAGFLRALGVPGPDVPDGAEERSVLYRSTLAGRRMLLVLDNARDSEQVRPLLPGDHSCAVVITSRDALTGLVARDGARRLDLDLLSISDAIDLLRSLIGGRVEAEPQAAVAMADRCCRLPLALRIAAEMAAARPSSSLADLADELADGQQRLDVLAAGGDVRAAVRTVFSWSYRHLDPAAAQVFRVLGAHPGTLWDAHAVAALAGSTPAQASQVLEVLRRAYLVEPAGRGCYTQHDLLRAYARELTACTDSPAERRAAQARLTGYYLRAAGTAMDALFPAERHRRPRLADSAVPFPGPPDDAVAARAWLDAERANLVAIAELAAGHGWREQACDLAAVLHRYLDKGGHYAEAIAIHDCARRAARSAGDAASEATALVSLATVDGHQGRYERGAVRLRAALPLFAADCDLIGQARALGNLGAIEYYQGHHTEAEFHLQEAVALYRQASDLVGEERMLANLGTLSTERGRYTQAKGYLRQALAICDEIGNLTGKAHVLGALGRAELLLGQYQLAGVRLQEALDLAAQAGDRAEQARILCDLGENELRQGRTEQALAHPQQALELARDIGDQSAMCQAYLRIGEVMLTTGRPGLALDAYQQALNFAALLRERQTQASAHEGLGEAHHAAGDIARARHHWQQAIALFSGLGIPAADRIGARLAAAELTESPQPRERLG
jgi:tetratricopeptide (TPR) repeat protein/DNA-binding XRE family transcriptional regulator